MRVYFWGSKSLGRGFAGILFIGFAALVFFQMIKIQSAAIPAQAIYQGNSGEKAVAFCVNVDWGEEFLPEMLTVLKKEEAQVTFFVTGQWAEKNPDLLRQMHEAGHGIQNHGYKHAHFNNLSGEDAREQIVKGGQIIKELTGTTSVYFAPPYGEFNNNLVKAAENLNHKLIMWSVDTIDWQLPTAETIIKRVMNQIHSDAIILMHPTRPTAEALPELIIQIKKSGYQIKNLDQIIVDEKKPANEKTNN